MARAAHVPNWSSVRFNKSPIGGKIKTEMALRIKTIERAVAIVSVEAFTIGEMAEMALPPQMLVPVVIRRDKVF